MKIVIFSGTTEGRELSQLLTDAGAEVTVCVASEYGAEEQGRVSGAEIRTGPLSAEEKRDLLRDKAICVDATHPYAVHVTASVREACREAGVEYLRLLRPPSEAGGAHAFETAEAAAAWLAGQEGRILLATGTRELAAFRRLDPERHRNIIAMQGPFTRELNAALIRQYNIRFVVTKDGGAPGGFPEKAEAAAETGAQLVVLRRPDECGLPFQEVLNQCMMRLRTANIMNVPIGTGGEK